VGMHKWLKGCTLMHTYPIHSVMSSLVSEISNKKLASTLAFAVPPDERVEASCHALGVAALSPEQLKMVFKGTVKDRPVTVLFDSGASKSFLGSELSKELGLQLSSSIVKSVATASGNSVPCHGSVTVPLRLGPIRVNVEGNVLPTFLSGIDLILGQDFMTTTHAILDYGVGRCIITRPKRTVLSHGDVAPDATATETAPKPSTHEHDHGFRRKRQRTSCGTSSHSQQPTESKYIVSAAVAASMLKEGCESWVAFIKPEEPVYPPPPPLNSAPAEPVKSAFKIPDNVPSDYAVKLQALIDQYSDVFCEKLPAAKPGGPSITAPEMIPLVPGSKIPYRKSYRMSPLEMAELKKQISEFLSKGWIQPSTSPFGAPVLFVKKKSGELRCVLDYRELNKITIKNKHPIPLIADLLDQCRGSSIYSALDLASGFYQLRLSDADVPRTAFNTPWAHYEWKVLVMGLANSPATFTTAMNKVFADLISTGPNVAEAATDNPDNPDGLKGTDRFVLVYLDDVLIMSKSPEEHLRHLEQVFIRLRDNGLYAKFSKCDFFQKELKYLGHIISGEGIKPDPAKVKSLVEWEYPKNATGMLQFLGLGNYFRRFIPNFSRIACALYHLTKKNVPFSDAPEYKACFEQLKLTLINPPVLAYPDNGLAYELISDASITGCGAVLVQEGRPIAYFSSKFSSAERNYTTTEQEMLGIIKALKEWRCYLEGCKSLVIVTDHNPLTYFQSQPTLSRRQARWSEFMSRFDFSVIHMPGVKNPADPLSRLYSDVVMNLLLAVTISEFSPDLLDQIKTAYASDPLFTDDKWTRKLTQENGIWYYQRHIAVPAGNLRKQIIVSHHCDISSGHFGVNKTLDLISRQFWWPNMIDDVKAFVSTCVSCQKDKAPNHLPYGLLNPLELPDTRWSTVTMDFITDLPRSSKGHDALYVFVDKLTKMVHIAPCNKTCTAEKAAELFISHVYQYHGLPRHFVSDRDGRFISTFWTSFCEKAGIKHKYSTSFHPQTDGQTERANRVIEEVLRHFIDGSHKNWEELLPFVTFAINNSKSDSTGETPFFLNTGTHPTTFNTQFIPTDRLPALDKVLHNISDTLIRVKELHKSAQDRQKAYADRRRQASPFKEGDLVLLSTKNLKFKTGIRKLHPKFVGPFKITRTVTDTAAELALPPTYRIHPVFHVSLLKPFKADGSFKPLPDEDLEILDGIDGTPNYAVERILSHRTKKSGRRTKHEYLIKWEGYDDTHNSWEPEENLTPDLLTDYHKP